MPVAFSQGFTPHPKVSYASASPTGAASEAEYLELGLRAPMDPDELVTALDAALSPGLDVREAVVVTSAASLADRLEAAAWRVELPGVEPVRAQAAVTAFEAADSVPVERVTKQGRRQVDLRSAIVSLTAGPEVTAPTGVGDVPCAILDYVVRHVTPSVRPDDVLSGLRVVADLAPSVPLRATRLAQGPLTAQGEIVDPLAADRGGGPVDPAG